MSNENWRESVQKLAIDARASGDINMAGVARRAGFSPSGLHNFMELGTGGDENIRALENILRERGFGEPVEAPKKRAKPRGRDINEVLAEQFESVASTLRADLPQEIKTDAYLKFVDSHTLAVETYRGKMEKSGDDV